MRNILLFFVLLSCLPLSAQRIVGGSGAAGIVILWEGKLPKGQTVSVKRREVGTAQFNFGRTLRLAQTTAEVLENVRHIPAILRDALPISDTMARLLLQKSRSAATVEELPLGIATNVQMALGIGFADTTVVPGKSYEYTLEIDGKLATENLNIRHAPDEKRITWIPQAHKSSSGPTQVKCTWSIPGGKRKDVYSFLVFRSEAFKLGYQPVACIRGFTGSGDTVLAVIRDTTLRSLGVWHYIIRTMSRFGELGPLSEYVQVSNFPPESAPFMPFFEAKGEDKAPCIQLKWRLKNPQRVKSLALYRSRHASKDFQLLGHFPPTDSTLRDFVGDVMESYFYYFEIQDIASTKPARSPMVTSLSKYRPAAMPPKNVRAENTNDDVTIRWDASGTDARGFYVWRTEGYGDKLELASGFLPKGQNQSVMSWTDTSFSLRGDREYSYAVLSESHGYLKSELSEKVQIRPKRKVFISAPTGLNLIKTGERQYRLFWKDLSESGERLTGYRVFLKKKGKYEALADTAVQLDQNWCDVPNLRHGDSLTLKSLGVFGNESGFALPVGLNDPAQLNFGPRYLKCYSEQEGIRLSWNRPSGQTLQRYRLYRSNDNGKPAMIQSLSAEVSSFTDKSAQKGETYYYFIVGEDASGNLSNGSEPAVVSR